MRTNACRCDVLGCPNMAIPDDFEDPTARLCQKHTDILGTAIEGGDVRGIVRLGVGCIRGCAATDNESER